MKSFKSYLGEVFDSTIPMVASKGYLSGNFDKEYQVDIGGLEYHVLLTHSTKDDNTYFVEFGRYYAGRRIFDGVLGDHSNAVKIFTACINVVKLHLSDIGDKNIVFSADVKDTSRVKLYKVLASKAASSLNRTLEVSTAKRWSGDEAVYFALVKK